MSDKPDHERARAFATDAANPPRERSRHDHIETANLARAYLDFADSPDHAPAPPARPLPEEGDEEAAREWARSKWGDTFAGYPVEIDAFKAGAAHGRRQGEAELVEARKERNSWHAKACGRQADVRARESEVRALREALRHAAIVSPDAGTTWDCRCCKGAWVTGQSENHSADCPAAPSPREPDATPDPYFVAGMEPTCWLCGNTREQGHSRRCGVTRHGNDERWCVPCPTCKQLHPEGTAFPVKTVRHRTAFPLLCADSGDHMDEDRYLILGEGDEPPEGHAVRRCRVALATEVVTVYADEYAERLDEDLAGDGPVTPGGSVFARWDDEIVSAKPGAQEALRAWANEWLEVRAWVVGPAARQKGETDGD